MRLLFCLESRIGRMSTIGRTGRRQNRYGVSGTTGRGDILVLNYPENNRISIKKKIQVFFDFTQIYVIVLCACLIRTSVIRQI